MTIRFLKFTVLDLAASAALAANIGLVVIAGVWLFTSTPAEAIPPASTGSSQAPASAPPEAMKIVPAEALEPTPRFFIGTGDQSVGYWTGPSPLITSQKIDRGR